MPCIPKMSKSRAMAKQAAEGMAHGGEVERPKSIAEAIMRKRKMADGGMVEDNYEDRNEMADVAIGDDEDAPLFPELPGSSELGNEMEDESENKLDMISSIRKKLKQKRGF